MFYERCQLSDCPFTKGWENINHAVKPGCLRYDVPMIYEPQSVIAPPKCISEPTKNAKLNISEHKRFRQDPGYISRFSVKTSVGELTPEVK